METTCDITKLGSSVGKPVIDILSFGDIRPIWTSKNGRIYRLNSLMDERLMNRVFELVKDKPANVVHGFDASDTRYLIYIDSIARIMCFWDKRETEGIFWNLK